MSGWLARFRALSERHLRLAAMEDLCRRYPDATVRPYREPGGLFWRTVFVPFYRLLPWSLRQRVMVTLMAPKGWGDGRSRWAGPPTLPPLSD